MSVTHELARLAADVRVGAEVGTVGDPFGRQARSAAIARVAPATVDEVARVMAWCYEHDVPMTPLGGGTGVAGGAIPLADDGIILSLEHLNRVRRFEPLLWRMQPEAGVVTARVHRLARENGLRFPPDPGAAEQSFIGGNIATNAGGPHAFKYGVTGNWVSGLEAVIPPGVVVNLGGAVRKDVSGYDLRALMIGSEGTLGIVTAAWLRLIPAPEAELPVVAFFSSYREGCEAIEALHASGSVPSSIEFLDELTLRLAGATLPWPIPDGASFVLIVEAEGSRAEAAAVARELAAAAGEVALDVLTPTHPEEIAALWRWRAGVALTLAAKRGVAVTEDIGVPIDRLADAIEASAAIGERHGLATCAFGHAGDGNVHTIFLLQPADESEYRAVEAASHDLYEFAIACGGTISAEHGVGLFKNRYLRQQLGPDVLAVHQRIKSVFDPKHLLNPGKKDGQETPSFTARRMIANTMTNGRGPQPA